jgi:hypothetical protein
VSLRPFVSEFDLVERIPPLRAPRAIGLTFTRQHCESLEALARAESEAAAPATALRLLDRLPALPNRKLLRACADLSRPL